MHWHQSGFPAAGRVALFAVFAACLLTWSPNAAAQAPPECAPEKTLTVTLTPKNEERVTVPLVATNEASVSAEFSGYTQRELFTLPSGGRMLLQSSGGFTFVVPGAASVAVTVSWRQAADPSDPDSSAEEPGTSCNASRVVTLPIESARRTRAVKQRFFGVQAYSPFAVVPDSQRPDLSPLEISIRFTSRARYPSASAKVRRMVVPMRASDELKYRTRLPGTFARLPTLCRLYYLTCGTVYSQVGRLGLEETARPGVFKPSVNGATELLARTQPARIRARYGVSVEATPGSNRPGNRHPFGLDVRVHQSGRLVARVRAAGTCIERSGSSPFRCRVRRSVQFR